MNFYPLFLNLENKQAVIFGAGKVGLRKAKALLKSGASVKVSSLEFSLEFKTLARRNRRLRLVAGKQRPESLLKKADLVFLATSETAWNKKMAQKCRREKIWVNVADNPRLCDFFVPSRLKKGNLDIAISTGGSSPYLAKQLRQELDRRLRPEALKVLGKIGVLRRELKRKINHQNERLEFLKGKLNKKIKFLN